MLQCFNIRNLLEVYLMRKSFLDDGFEKQFNLSNFSFIQQYYKVSMLIVVTDHSLIFTMFVSNTF